MKVIGFNFTKIAAEKLKHDIKKMAISTNVKFLEIEKDKADVIKDELVKVYFQYGLNYEDQNNKNEKDLGNITFEGKITLSVSGSEAKDLLKSWKKKDLPENFKIPIYNLILRKCTPRALSLQDEVELPFHMSMPRIGRKQ